MDKLNLNVSHIHLIGIGGSGMYPIVQILRGLNYNVSGSDVEDGATLNRVRDLGVKVYIGQSSSNLEGAELVVYSAAISKENPELQAAIQKQLKLFTRAEFLGLISQQYKNSICISGTHGKTTTSALLTQILLKTGHNPGVVVGGVLPLINGSGCVGDLNTFVCEACEFSNTFLNLNSNISIVLNIDNDHLEFFGSMDNLIASFKQFCSQTKNLIIYNGDDKDTKIAGSDVTIPKISFGLNEDNDYYAKNITESGFRQTSFDLFHKAEKLVTITYRIPGNHNVYNVLAACVAALHANVAAEELPNAVSEFYGAARRFEILYESPELAIVDDYAHHPTEIKATLKAAKQTHYKNIWAIFQPFTYSRTAALLKDFADVLKLADHCVITDIMGSREINTLGIHAQALVDLISNAKYISNFDDICEYIIKNVPQNTLVITLGCGNIYKVSHKLAQQLKGEKNE